MELSPKQQVTELIKKFNRILVVSHARPDGDALGSLLAMTTVLTALGKEAVGVVRDPIPGTYRFMPGITKLQKEISGSRDLIVSVDTAEVPVDKLKYNTRDHKLNIIVTPKRGSYAEGDVSITSGSFKFDLIIVLDAPDLDRLGVVYEEHPDLFYETPVVNIDHHPSNDYFGAVNLVDLTATSTSEILVGVIESLGESLITEDVATCLLTGLITDTGSFQNSNTTPKSLTVSAQLVATGGRQQEIVQHVYKTKPLSTLKLWGRALTRLQYDAEARLVWSSITAKDFADTGGTASEAKEVIDALMSSAPDAEIILLLRQGDGKVDGSVRTTKGIDALKIVGKWGGGGHTGAAGFEMPGTLAEVEPKTVADIKAWQQSRLGGGPAKAANQTVDPEEDEEPDPTAHPTPQTVEQALKIAQDAEQQRASTKPQSPARDTQAGAAASPETPTAASPAPQPADSSENQPTPNPATPSPQNQPPTNPATPQNQPAQTPRVSPPENPPAPAQPPASSSQAPLSDDELDAYFRKTLGGKDDVIDQPASGNPTDAANRDN